MIKEKVDLSECKNILRDAGIFKYTNNTDILSKLNRYFENVYVEDQYELLDLSVKIDFLKEMIICLETTNLNKIFNPSSSKLTKYNLTFDQLNNLFERELPDEYIKAKLGQSRKISFKTIADKDPCMQNKTFKKYFKELKILDDIPYTDEDLLNLIESRTGELELANKGTNTIKFTHSNLKCKSIKGSLYVNYSFDIYTINLYDLINRYIANGIEPNLDLNIKGKADFKDGNFETDVITYNGIDYATGMVFLPDEVNLNDQYGANYLSLFDAFDDMRTSDFSKDSVDNYVEILNSFIK